MLHKKRRQKFQLNHRKKIRKFMEIVRAREFYCKLILKIQMEETSVLIEDFLVIRRNNPASIIRK